MNRRQLIGWGLGAGALISVGGAGVFYRRQEVALLSAASIGDKHYGVLLDAKGRILQQTALPSRAHAAVYNPDKQQALFFSRRPGTELYVVGLGKKGVATVNSEPGRHFYGHGILSADNRYLLATENDYQAGRGVISIRDAKAGYRLINEIPSHGIGPHELAFVSDDSGATDKLVVANGGLLTHPQLSRVPKNIDSMQPNISFIQWQEDRLLSQWEPPNNQLSLRHLSVEKGVATIGAQYQGAALDDVPLVFSASEHSDMKALAVNNNFNAAHAKYTASVCSLREGGALVSCPKANRVSLWDKNTLLQSAAVRDVAGLARLRSSDTLIYSSGDGTVGTIRIDKNRLFFTPLQIHSGLRWDNHLIAVS
ncbi:DUF1513 domain-containing protein [Teredinibacter purpureus]|uniref:DUF1513 domain-containing protein n=1 Tax=Teredinibacter purpureus TaxID=2731756 RepID=UPI0005F7AF09|nr:DUF1513 domain-containing protein [Teredinibacter purpureus]